MSLRDGWTMLLLTLMLGCGTCAWGEGTVVGAAFTITWTASPTPRVVGYQVYVSTTRGVYDRTKPIPLPKTPTSAPGSVLGLTTDGQYYLVMTAVADPGGESVFSDEVPFMRQTTLPLPAPDVTPPLIAIRTPVDGAEVTRNSTLPITVDASDNVGITRLQVTVNGQSVCPILFAPPWVCPWPIPRASGARYLINALAIDASGNNAQSQIEVIAK